MSSILCKILVVAAAVLLATPANAAAAQGARPGIGPNNGVPIGTPFALPEGLEVAGPIVSPRLMRQPDGSMAHECPDGSKFAKPRTSVQGCVPVCNWAPGTMSAAFPPGLVIVAASETYQNGLIIERIVVRVPPKNCNANGNALRHKDPVLEKKRGLAPAGALWIPVQAYCLSLAKIPTDGQIEYRVGPITSDAKLLAVLAQIKNRHPRTSAEEELIQDLVYTATEPGRRPLDAKERARLLVIPRL